MTEIANWSLVGLTAIYVVATIFICLANRRAAAASKEQTDEMRRQFAESSRARVIVRFDKRSVIDRCVVLKNIGFHDAVDVTVSVDDAFLNDLNNVCPENRLSIISKSKIHIASQQEFWVFLGFAPKMDAMQSQIAKITVSYKDGSQSYIESTAIDFSQYDFMTTIITSNTANQRATHDRERT